MSGPGGAPYFGEYPVDFFDFFVIDEGRRGGANDAGSWRAILDHSAPAVQLGLTAKNLGSPEQIRSVFVGFQQYLYQA